MTRKMILMVLAVAFLATSASGAVKLSAGENAKVKFYGLSQVEMRGGGDADRVRFAAQRLRLGANYYSGPWFSKLQLDFNQSATAGDAGLPKLIKDAFVGYKHSDACFVKLGMMKTPVGMGFTIPGWNLDNTGRSKMDKGLVLERDFGFMVSGRNIGGTGESKPWNGDEVGIEKQPADGFGYDVGLFNPAGRSAAVTWDASQLGAANAYAGRVHFDRGWPLHMEFGYGVSEQAGGVDTGDYEVMDFGFASTFGEGLTNIKFEYVAGSTIKGEDGWDQTCLVGTACRFVSPKTELVVKHYNAKAERGGTETELTNTYLGVNLYISPLGGSHNAKQAHRIQLNYVLVGGDGVDADVPFNGLAGMMDDGWVVQWQTKF